jgi:hypothetical protein
MKVSWKSFQIDNFTDTTSGFWDQRRKNIETNKESRTPKKILIIYQCNEGVTEGDINGDRTSHWALYLKIVTIKFIWTSKEIVVIICYISSHLRVRLQCALRAYCCRSLLFELPWRPVGTGTKNIALLSPLMRPSPCVAAIRSEAIAHSIFT